MKKRIRKNNWTDVILNYLGKECIYCGSIDKLNIHHIIPLSKGGKNEISNLEVLCQKCHHLIHKQLAYIFPKKTIIPVKCKYCNRKECKCHLFKRKIKSKYYK